MQLLILEVKHGVGEKKKKKDKKNTKPTPRQRNPTQNLVKRRRCRIMKHGTEVVLQAVRQKSVLGHPLASQQ